MTETAGTDAGFEYPEVDSDRPEPWEVIFDAPDFSTLVKSPKTAVARDYETRTLSALKAYVIFLINSGNMKDAAAVLQWGPSFGAATGELAGKYEPVRKGIDLASTPASPLVTFFAVVMPFLGQLARNHEEEISQIPFYLKNRKNRKESGIQVERVTLKVFGRFITLPIRRKFNPFKILVAGFQTQTKEPTQLIFEVFNDEKLITALNKQGVRIRGVRVRDGNPG